MDPVRSKKIEVMCWGHVSGAGKFWLWLKSVAVLADSCLSSVSTHGLLKI